MLILTAAHKCYSKSKHKIRLSLGASDAKMRDYYFHEVQLNFSPRFLWLVFMPNDIRQALSRFAGAIINSQNEKIVPFTQHCDWCQKQFAVHTTLRTNCYLRVKSKHYGRWMGLSKRPGAYFVRFYWSSVNVAIFGVLKIIEKILGENLFEPMKNDSSLI